MTLVVIHGDHHVEITALSQKKQGVCRERPLHIPSSTPARLHRTGQRREQLGMSGKEMTACMKCFLIKGSGADGLNAAVHREPGCDFEITVGCISGDRRYLAPWEIVRDQGKVNAVNGSGSKT